MALSPLAPLHEELGARFVDFGGWEMPLQYQSVLAEHRAVRESAGWFDVSHLGRFSLQGPGSLAVLARMLTNDVAAMAIGKTQYNLHLNENGGIDDDLLVWRWEGEDFWVLPNAATHDEIVERFRQETSGARITDLRLETAMLAVQGPEAPRLLEEVVGSAPRRFATLQVDDLRMAGTGYTGERGGEVVGSPARVRELAERLTAAGARPCGLGARDTLRLEAGLLLAGQDFDPTTDPFEAGLEWAVSWNHDFVGREALARRSQPPQRRLQAFALPGRIIPRHGYPLRSGPSQGLVTSGNFSPMLEQGIGLGYLSPPYREGPLEVEIRGRWEEATSVDLPFYQR